MLVYHFTTERKLEKIFQEGLLKTSDVGIEPQERPAVWFSKNPNWENTANKSVEMNNGSIRALSSQETLKICGWVRIAVDEGTAPHSWEQYKKLSGVSKKTANSLRNTASEVGSDVSDWRVSFNAVPSQYWIGIHRWNAGKWVDAVENGKLIPMKPRNPYYSSIMRRLIEILWFFYKRTINR